MWWKNSEKERIKWVHFFPECEKVNTCEVDKKISLWVKMDQKIWLWVNSDGRIFWWDIIFYDKRTFGIDYIFNLKNFIVTTYSRAESAGLNFREKRIL